MHNKIYPFKVNQKKISLSTAQFFNYKKWGLFAFPSVLLTVAIIDISIRWQDILPDECHTQAHFKLMAAVQNIDPYQFSSPYSSIISNLSAAISFAPFILLLFNGPAIIRVIALASGSNDLDQILLASTKANLYTSMGLWFKNLVKEFYQHSGWFKEFALRPEKVIKCFNLKNGREIGFPSNHTLDFAPFFILSTKELYNNYQKLSTPMVLMHSFSVSITAYSMYSRYAFSWHTCPQIAMSLAITFLPDIINILPKNISSFLGKQTHFINLLSCVLVGLTLSWLSYQPGNGVTDLFSNTEQPAFWIWWGILISLLADILKYCQKKNCNNLMPKDHQKKLLFNTKAYDNFGYLKNNKQLIYRQKNNLKNGHQLQKNAGEGITVNLCEK